MVENRRVGIKSREIYECPAALALLLAHADLEDLTLERDVAHEKARLEPRWAELVYDGLWFSPLKEALDAFFATTQRHVTGEVRLALAPGQLRRSTGRRSPVVALRPRPRHLRRRRHLPPRRRRGLRPALGSRRRDLGGPPGRRRAVRAPDAGRTRRDALGGPARRDGRRGHGLHRQPALRPAAGRRRPRRVARPRPGPRRGPASSTSGEAAILAGRPRPGRGGAGVGELRLPARATRTSTPPSSGGSPSSPATSGPSSTPGGAATTRWPPTCACTRRRELLAVAAAVIELQDVLLHRAVEAGDAYLPATPTCSGPSRCCSPTTSSPTAGRWRATSTGCCTRVVRMDVCPLGAGALAGSSLPLDPDGVAEELGFGEPLRELARRRVRPRLRGRGALRPGPAGRPPVAAGRGDRAVVERGVRLRRPRRRLRHGELDAAPEEEPRRGRAGPGQGGPADRPPGRDAGHAEGPAARLQPRPPGGQGAAVRRRRPGRAGAAGRDGDARPRRTSTPTRMRDAADGPAAAAVDLAEWLVERGMPFRQAHAVVGSLVRDSVAARRAAGRARPGQPASRHRRAGPARAGRGRDPAHLAGRGGARARGRAAGAVPPPARARPPARQPRRGRGARRRGARPTAVGRATGRERRPRRRAPAPGAAAAASTPAARSRWPPDCSTSCWSRGRPGGPDRRGGGVPGERRTPPRTPTGARPPRNATMFGPPGHLYVYFTYGMHFCANVVCRPEGTAEAVLLRALAPVAGLDAMRAAAARGRHGRRARRAARPSCARPWASTGADDGADLVHRATGGCASSTTGWPPPTDPASSGRVGIRQAAELPWRWWVPGDPNVSRPRAPGRCGPEPVGGRRLRSRHRAAVWSCDCVVRVTEWRVGPL